MQQATGLLDPHDDLRRLVDDVLSSPNRAHAVALVNERLSEVSANLDVGADVPRAAARICAFSATTLALIVLITSLPRPEDSVAAAATALAAGFVGAAITWQLGAVARARSRRQREAWNELVRRLTPLLPPEAQAPEIAEK